MEIIDNGESIRIKQDHSIPLQHKTNHLNLWRIMEITEMRLGSLNIIENICKELKIIEHHWEPTNTI